MSDNQFNFGPTVISNSLNDSSTTKALSAAKGKELSESIIKPITIDLDTVTNTSGSYTHTTTIATTGLITEGMKCIGLEVGNPAAFGDMPTITAGNDEITLSCSSVSGTSTVKVTMMRTTQATSSGIMPMAVTSEEFDILADRIGDIDDLTTTAKTDVVAAVNSLKTSSDEHNTAIGSISYQIGTWNSSWTLLGTAPYQSDYTVTQSLSNYKELLLILKGSTSIPASILYPVSMGVSSGVMQARYKTESNDSRDAYFDFSTKILSTASTGYTAYLYAR